MGMRTPGYSHAERLHVIIDQVLHNAQVKGADIKAVAISKGPGSYTGLRIGVSAAKGLAFAWNIPLISCTSLEALVDRMRIKYPGFDCYVPMLDARRMEVYCQEFTANGAAKTSIEARVIEENSFDHLKGKKVLFAGDGAVKCSGLLKDEGWMFKEMFPEALGMTERVQQSLSEKRFEDVAYFEPYYLKEFIAGKPKAAL